MWKKYASMEVSDEPINKIIVGSVKCQVLSPYWKMPSIIPICKRGDKLDPKTIGRSVLDLLPVK